MWQARLRGSWAGILTYIGPMCIMDYLWTPVHVLCCLTPSDLVLDAQLCVFALQREPVLVWNVLINSDTFPRAGQVRCARFQHKSMTLSFLTFPAFQLDTANITSAPWAAIFQRNVCLRREVTHCGYLEIYLRYILFTPCSFLQECLCLTLP
jgi:hypothetical protein